MNPNNKNLTQPFPYQGVLSGMQNNTRRMSNPFERELSNMGSSWGTAGPTRDYSYGVGEGRFNNPWGTGMARRNPGLNNGYSANPVIFGNGNPGTALPGPLVGNPIGTTGGPMAPGGPLNWGHNPFFSGWKF